MNDFIENILEYNANLLKINEDLIQANMKLLAENKKMDQILRKKLEKENGKSLVQQKNEYSHSLRNYMLISKPRKAK